MYPDIHMQSIRSHHRIRVFISCRGIQPDRLAPEASRIKAYNLFRGLIPMNCIRIFSLHFLQPEAHSVPYGPVRLLACVKKRARAVNVKSLCGSSGCRECGIGAARESIAFDTGV